MYRILLWIKIWTDYLGNIPSDSQGSPGIQGFLGGLEGPYMVSEIEG